MYIVPLCIIADYTPWSGDLQFGVHAETACKGGGRGYRFQKHSIRIAVGNPAAGFGSPLLRIPKGQEHKLGRSGVLCS